MPIRLFHQITSIAGDAMLPHVAGAARSLAARCADELANVDVIACELPQDKFTAPMIRRCLLKHLPAPSIYTPNAPKPHSEL